MRALWLNRVNSKGQSLYINDALFQELLSSIALIRKANSIALPLLFALYYEADHMNLWERVFILPNIRQTHNMEYHYEKYLPAVPG